MAAEQDSSCDYQCQKPDRKGGHLQHDAPSLTVGLLNRLFGTFIRATRVEQRRNQPAGE